MRHGLSSWRIAPNTSSPAGADLASGPSMIFMANGAMVRYVQGVIVRYVLGVIYVRHSML